MLACSCRYSRVIAQPYSVHTSRPSMIQDITPVIRSGTAQLHRVSSPSGGHTRTLSTHLVRQPTSSQRFLSFCSSSLQSLRLKQSGLRVPNPGNLRRRGLYGRTTVTSSISSQASNHTRKLHLPEPSSAIPKPQTEFGDSIMSPRPDHYPTISI